MFYDFVLALAATSLVLSPLMIDTYPSRALRRRIRALPHQENLRQEALQGEALPLATEAPVFPTVPARVRVTPRNVLKWLFLQQEAVQPRSSGKSA